jgi:hypothetical protein
MINKKSISLWVAAVATALSSVPALFAQAGDKLPVYLDPKRTVRSASMT